MRPPRWNRLLYAAAAALALIGLYAAVGVFARPVMDDVCLTRRALDDSIVGVVSDQFWNWSGNVIGLYYQVAGAVWRLHHINPSVVLLVWVAAFAWLSWESLALAGLPRSRGLAVLLGALLTLALNDISPNIGQTLYWLNGTANYGVTSAMFVMTLALLLRIARLGARRVHFVTAALLTFTAVLGQIVMVLHIMALLALALLFVLVRRELPHRRDLIRFLCTALAAGAIGSALVILTPGNDLRQAIMQPSAVGRISLFAAAIQTLPIAVGKVVLSAVFFAPGTHVFLAGLGYFGARLIRPPSLSERTLPRRVRWQVLLAAVAAGIVLFYLGSFASMYSLGILGPPRLWVPPQSLWLVVVLLAGYAFGLTFPPAFDKNRMRRYAAACVVGLLAIAAINLAALVPQYRDFAQDYDARMALIEAAIARGETDMVVPPYRTPVRELMVIDNTDDIICVRRFYRLQALVIEAKGE